jgi:hypothetical protein
MLRDGCCGLMRRVGVLGQQRGQYHHPLGCLPQAGFFEQGNSFLRGIHNTVTFSS